MARQKQPAPTTATASTTFPTAEAVDITQLVEDLDGMLTRLRLGAIREQLDALLEEAARRQLNLREALEPRGPGAGPMPSRPRRPVALTLLEIVSSDPAQAEGPAGGQRARHGAVPMTTVLVLARASAWVHSYLQPPLH